MRPSRQVAAVGTSALFLVWYCLPAKAIGLKAWADGENAVSWTVPGGPGWRVTWLEWPLLTAGHLKICVAATRPAYGPLGTSEALVEAVSEEQAGLFADVRGAAVGAIASAAGFLITPIVKRRIRSRANAREASGKLSDAIVRIESILCGASAWGELGVVKGLLESAISDRVLLSDPDRRRLTAARDGLAQFVRKVESEEPEDLDQLRAELAALKRNLDAR